MRNLALTSLALAMLAATSSAQCGTLTANGTGAPGTTLELALTGSTANAFAALAVGDTLGSTTLNVGPLGSLTLGLASPFIALPLGRTDGNGDATLSINVPTGVTNGVDLFAQGVALGFSFGPMGPSLSFCVSNTQAFHLGN